MTRGGETAQSERGPVLALLDRLVAPISARAKLRVAARWRRRGRAAGAFRLLSRAARTRLPEACYRLGRCYLDGTGVPASRRDGARWLEQAALQGHREAQALLASLFLQGMVPGPPRQAGRRGSALFTSNDAAAGPDFAMAAKWARPAAEAGSADAQAVLGYILTSGPAEMRDLPAARQWYRLAAVGGSPQGALGHALVLARGEKTPEEEAEVARWLRRAADAGLPAALYLLGVMTERGTGVPSDRAAAVALFREAAEKGSRSAQLRWGVALMEGFGVRANPVAGESWLRKAALAGNAEAAARLGAIYVRADPLPPNHAEAAMWFEQAAASGHQGAARVLRILSA